MSSPLKEITLTRGDKIIARNDMFGYFFPARVSRIFDAKYANVKFDDGTRKSNMPVKHIIKINESLPYLSVGDHVMAKVLNEFDTPCWVPGVVQSIRTSSPQKMYIILYFNGKEGDNIRSELIKISQNLYAYIVNYIRSLLGEKTTSATLKVYHEQRFPEQPPLRPLSPPDMDKIKKDIIFQIKDHFNSLQIDEKYERMFDELTGLKKSQKEFKNDLEGKFKLLRNDFEEWKRQEPPIIIPNPNAYVYVKNKKSKKKDGTEANQVYEFPKSDSPDLSLEQKILKLRAELPEIKPGEEVLAKWPDDGWYYRSIVKENLGSCRYLVEDSLRDYESIYREDIISGINEPNFDFEIGDPVVAMHPNYEFSYAPGQIVHISNDMSTYHVRFYDYIEGVVHGYEIFKIPRLKFQSDIDKILELEKRWIGQKAIARNNFNRVYELGKVIGQVNTGRQYVIEWPDGSESIQNANHIFGKYTRNKAIHKNEYVLAPKETIFLPGRISARRGNQLIVRYCDGSVDENVNEDDCFWLSKDYYDDAWQFCRRELDIDYENESEKKKILIRESSFVNDSEGRKTPVIDARDFYSGKKASIKLKPKY